MIRRDKSRSGLEIKLWNEKLLCSRNCPQEEAENFVSEHLDRLHESSVVVVLGLGCGYHINALLKAYPAKKLVVVETEKSLIGDFQLSYPIESAMVDFVNVKSVDEFKANYVLRSRLRSFYSVAKFFSATVTNVKLYSEFEELLLGRQPKSLKWLIELRGDRVERPLKISLVDRNLWLKDIISLANQSDYLEKNKVSLDVLVELVK